MTIVAFYPREGLAGLWLDANNVPLLAAGRYLTVSTYVNNAELRGDISTVDPLDVYQPTAWLGDPTAGNGGAPVGAQYIVASADATLTNDLVLTAGTGVTITQGAGTMTIAASGGGGGAPTDAEYLVSSLSAGLSAERLLQAGANISLTPSAGALTVAATNVAPATASYVTIGTDGTLTNERTLAAGANITITDNGPGSSVTIAATGSGAPVGAQYLVAASDATLTNERVLQAGAGITLTPGAGTMTISSPTNAMDPNAAYALLTGPVPSGMPNTRVLGISGGVNLDTTNPLVWGLNAQDLQNMSAVVIGTPIGVNAPSQTRKLTAGAGINIADGGAGGNVTISTTGAAPNTSTFLCLSADGALTNERVITAGSNVSFVDNGPGGSFVINVTGVGGGGAGTSPFLNVLDASVVQGTLSNNATRSNNRVNFTTAIANATSQKKMIVVPPGNYEIHGGAILMTIDSVRWLGTKESTITQWQLNVPCIHVGPPLGTSGASSISGVNIDGASLRYNGVGTPGANALELTGAWLCVFKNMDIGDANAPYGGRSSVPYCGIYWDGAAGTLPPFSNYFENIRVKHFVWRGISMERALNGGDGENTGNVFCNIYVSGGGAHTGGVGQQDISGIAGAGMIVATGHSELRLEQINCEWCTTPNAIFTNNCHGVSIDSFHIEGIELKQFSTDRAGFCYFYNSKVNAVCVTVYDSYCTASNSNDSGGIFLLGTGSRLTFDNLRVKSLVRTGTDLSIIRSAGYSGQDDVRVNAGSTDFAEQTGNFDRYDTWTFATAGQALYGYLADFDSDMFQVISAGTTTLTHYPLCSAGVLLQAPSGASVITLSRYMRASDNTINPTGVRRRIRRTGGAGSLTVANGGAGGGTFTVANGATIEVAFDGTNWVQTS